MTQRSLKYAAQVEANGTHLTEEAVRALSLAKDEPERVRARRLEAWRHYERMPMPGPQDEGWRRTSLSGVPFDTITPFLEPHPRATDVKALPRELTARIDGALEKAGLIVQQDSNSVHTFLQDNLAKQGVVLTDMDTAVRDYPELWQEYFMTSAIPAEDGKFAALHGAFWSGGTFIYVPPDVEVSLPIHSLVYLSHPGLGLFPHTVVVADRGSSVTLLEEHFSLTQEGYSLSIPLVEVFVKDGAQVRYVNVQEWQDNVYTIASHRTIVGRDAYVQACNIGLGGRLSKIHSETQMVGPGTRSEMLGLLFGEKRQHFDHYTLQDHRAPRTSSDLLFRSVLKDRARYVYYGFIKMRKEAQQSQGFQTDRNLLLTGRARADSIPVLEIEADDVKCSHASAPGPVDDDQLFYLMSRGLPSLEAERMLVEGFLEPVVARVPLPWLREKLAYTIQSKLKDQ